MLEKFKYQSGLNKLKNSAIDMEFPFFETFEDILDLNVFIFNKCFRSLLYLKKFNKGIYK